MTDQSPDLKWRTNGYVKIRRGLFDQKHVDRLTVQERWLFVVLCSQAEWTGVIAGGVRVPSTRELAKRSGLNRRTVVAGIRRLVDLEYLIQTGDDAYQIRKFNGE